jgi:hypothetical protein
MILHPNVSKGKYGRNFKYFAAPPRSETWHPPRNFTPRPCEIRSRAFDQVCVREQQVGVANFSVADSQATDNDVPGAVLDHRERGLAAYCTTPLCGTPSIVSLPSASLKLGKANGTETSSVV